MEIKKIIKLFRSNEINFNHNEMVLTECTVAKVTEDIEGIFDLDLEYPLFDEKGLSQYLVKGNIIQCPISQTDTRGNQLFKIRKRIKNTKTKRITVYAQAIARADLMKNWIAGCRVLAGNTRKQAITQILASCVEQQGYYVGNLDTNTNTSINLGIDEDLGTVINYLDIDVKNPLAGLIDEEKSVKKAYGGEIIFNNKEINIVEERGTDHSFIISSGKNLEELEEEVDDLDSENFATALTMRSSDGIYLPNQEIIYSPNAATLGNYFKLIVCDDVTAVDNTQASIDVVYAQLRERATKAFNDGIDKLKINNTINFIQLANTEEYKDYAELEKCEMGNNVTVKYEKANVEATGRVTKIIFDALRMKIEEVEIGERRKPTFVETVTNAVNKTTELNNKANSNTVKIKKVKQYTDETKENLIKYIGETETGILLEVKTADNALSSRIELTEEGIQSSVKKDEFGSLIQQNADSIVNAIEGVTDNKTTLNSSGFHVSGGAFDFEGYNGNMLIEAVSNGSIDAIRIGDSSWSKSRTFSHILLGGLPMDQYFLLSCIAIDTELDMEDNNIYTTGTIYTADLETSGNKNCVQDTENFGRRLINAYETAEYFFGDIGEDRIDETGKCIVKIEEIFKECVNTDINYHVFHSCYNGSISKVERFSDRFEVYGDVNTIFSWEIKAKRRGFENSRLELSKRQ